jgi:hypothetical protein
LGQPVCHQGLRFKGQVIRLYQNEEELWELLGAPEEGLHFRHRKAFPETKKCGSKVGEIRLIYVPVQEYILNYDMSPRINIEYKHTHNIFWVNYNISLT